ncbi:MAG: ATP-binding cassette domain-containing protein, partial [Oscillospiraceae bacterium]|nr:ATP-binding cassette domain-containing protein [Oscillospiraceae bacterium]
LYRGERISGRISKEMDEKVVRSCQMIFQDPMASLNERAKVDYIVSEGLYSGGKLPEEERKAKVEKALMEVGLLPEFASRFPHEFSGGQRQRIGVARALIMQPEFIIADEPISALDVSIRAQVLNLLSELQKERGLTYLFISHDLSVMRFICDRIAVIHKGVLVELAETEKLFAHPLHPYTRSLISAIPIPDPQLEKHKVLFTYDPSVHDYSEDKPELVDIGHGHFIYGNKKEIEEYKAIRERGEPLKSITILSEEEQAKNPASEREIIPASEFLLQTPIHDTGSKWYAIGSFFLPPVGLIAGFIFKKFKHLRNYKACLKGALSGLGVFVAIILLFCLLLALSVL